MQLGLISSNFFKPREAFTCFRKLVAIVNSGRPLNLKKKRRFLKLLLENSEELYCL